MLTHKLIGERLKLARKNSGFSQNEASEMLGISRQKIINVEKGESPIDTILLKAMADLYGYTVSHFLADVDKQKEVEPTFAFGEELTGRNTINWMRKVMCNIHDLQEITS